MNQSIPIIEAPVFTHSQDPEDCISKFFHALHGSDHLPWVLNVWTLPDKKSCFFRQQPYKTLAAKRGWKIDNTSDLVRVLRVPGTYNRKHGQVAVEVIDYQPACRYDPSEFEPWIAADAKESNGPNGHRVDPQWIFSGIREGRRNAELYRYACSLRSRNIPLVEAQILIAAAAKDCKPEYPAEEALAILKRAFREFAAGSSGGKESEWPQAQELPPLLPEAPGLPAEMLPGGLRPWLEDLAERMQVPLEVPAAAALVALSTVVGRNLGIHPKRHDDWLVIPNLWGLVVGPPGILKTPAANEALKPLGTFRLRRARNLKNCRPAIEPRTSVARPEWKPSRT